jgi:hypothetical protein
MTSEAVGIVFFMYTFADDCFVLDATALSPPPPVPPPPTARLTHMPLSRMNRKRIYMERFIEEAKMMSRLHHPNLQLLLGAWAVCATGRPPFP